VNANGVLDGGDSGIAGVTLTLSGTNNLGQSISANTTTASDGTYSFIVDSNGNALRPGTYQIAESRPSGYLDGVNAVGTVNGTADGTLVPTDKIGSIALTSGQSGINYLFGDVKPVALSGLVYQDTNGNGVLDSGEPGIANVTLTLGGTNNLGHSISATATTAANGTYSFTTDSNGNALAPGTYQITETAPSGYVQVAANVGTVNGSVDGNPTSAVKITAIVLASNQSGINYDFGEVKGVGISGLVYQDSNGNGALDNGEPGIAGVTLTLSGTNNLGQSISATTTTASDGTYTLAVDSNGKALLPGTYQVVETSPSGYLLGADAVGTVNGTTDGTLASATQISSIALTSGQSGINYYFGDVKPVAISGTVYLDSNADGVLDNGEPGIAGVTMTLSGTNGLGQSISATTTTAANGTYSFTVDSNGNALRPGTYQIAETPPGGYLQGVNTVGTVSGNGGSDGTLVPVDKIGSIVLTSGQSGINYNFGWVQPVTIAGIVYKDLNGNGVLDSGEPGFANVTLTLSGTNILGQSISVTAVSAADGTYSFTVDSNGNTLWPGTYQITETTPSGYVQVAANVGTVNGSVDGSAVLGDSITSIVMPSGQNGINYDFGLSLPAAVSGYVYVDYNRDGIYEPGNPDAALAGQTVTLTGTDAFGRSVNVTTTTDANGYYIFAGLFAGNYVVTLTAPGGIYNAEVANVGTVNGTQIGVANNSNLEIDQVQLNAGNIGVNYNFGVVGPQE